jgi:hypothetical protein
MRPLPFAFSALLLLAACSSVSAPDESRVVGAIAGYNADDPHVDAPTTADRGVPFPVVVRTYGGGCERADDTEVRVVGLTADVTPYDVTRLQAVCTQQLKTFTHTALVRIDVAGAGHVRVHGRGLGGEDILVERDVQVR